MEKIENTTNDSRHNGRQPAGARDPEVVPKARRRQFSAAYKLQIVEEADACTEPGEIGALLRREGLYSSHLTNWRRLRDAGKLQGGSKKRGRKADPKAAEIARLRQENERLSRELEKAGLIIDVQKKLAEVLGLTIPAKDDEP
jgi:transposase-like protein